MNINTSAAREYADFLEEQSRKIINLCNKIEGDLMIASQCMDQQAGRDAALSLNNSIETIKAAVPISDDACQRLILALRYVGQAQKTFGGR